MDTPKVGPRIFQSSLIQKEKHGQFVPRGLCGCVHFNFFFNKESLFSDNININNILDL